MSTTAYPTQSKTQTLASNITYSWVSIPSTSKPTILFLHGFPSTSYDWRHQIAHFSSLGYGIIAPDLLGYPDTDSPAPLEAYKYKAMTQDIFSILAIEHVEKVHIVGHDFGALFMSPLIGFLGRDRVLSATFLAVPYFPPGHRISLDDSKPLSEESLGFERFGYIRFMCEEGCADVFDKHVSV